MPIDILRRPNIWGESLSKGVNALAQGHLDYLTKKKREDALVAAGLPKEYAGFSDQLLATEMGNRSRAKIAADKLAGNQQFAKQLQDYLNGGSQQQIEPQEVNQRPIMQQQQYQPSEDELLGQKIFGAPKKKMTEGERLGQEIFGNNPPPIPSKKQQILPPEVQQQIQKKKERVPNLAGLNPQQAFQLAQLSLQKENLTRKEEVAKQALDKKENAKLQMQADKETLPYYNQILNEDKTAKKIDIDTKRMLKLIEKGNLPDPVYYKQLKDLEDNISPVKGAAAGGTAGAAIGGALGTLGGPLGTALGAAGGTLVGAGLGAVINPIVTSIRYGQLKKYPDAEEFEKLSNGFISGAKAIFGSRITDQDLRAFMATVPQLTNTEAGKKAIIRNIQLMNKAVHVKTDTMKRIINDNNGHRPIDLALRVEEESEPELDRLSNEFVNGVTATREESPYMFRENALFKGI